jgi:transposase InsO family protein
VVIACQTARQQKVPVVHVTRRLTLSERTVRRWRQRTCQAPAACLKERGRPPHCASRDERNGVFRFLRQRGGSTPLDALRAAFPALARRDLAEILRRYRQVERRKRQRHQSRLRWQQPGTVWAADFKERREPIEGRYSSILSIKDLASRCQLAWLPVEEGNAQAVQQTYLRLFLEHGPPLVLKSDNGGPFRDAQTKELLAAYRVTPLYNPRRHPAYNGGVERANGQLAGYQEAVAAAQGHAGLPTCADAEAARQLANDLARPGGWQAPTAHERWEQRPALTEQDRSRFLATVSAQRVIARAALQLPQGVELGHYPAAAVDRRAVRDALVEHGLLVIEPRRRPARATRDRKNESTTAHSDAGAAILHSASVTASSTRGDCDASDVRVAPLGQHPTERAPSSTDNSKASGQN